MLKSLRALLFLTVKVAGYGFASSLRHPKLCVPFAALASMRDETGCPADRAKDKGDRE